MIHNIHFSLAEFLRRCCRADAGQQGYFVRCKIAQVELGWINNLDAGLITFECVTIWGEPHDCIARTAPLH